MSYEKRITVGGRQYLLKSGVPITPEIERLELQKLSATCPSTSKIVGQTATLRCTPTAGTGPFTITFRKNGVQLTSPVQVPINTEASLDYVVTDADRPSITLSADAIDSCTNPGPSSTTESCSVYVVEPCNPVQIDFEVT